MKRFKIVLAVLPLAAALFMAGCVDMLMERPSGPEPAEGEGLLMVSLAGANVGAGRTLLPIDPRFTRYELEYTVLGSDPVTIPFYNSTLQLSLEAKSGYAFTVLGYDGDTLVAKSDEITGITISSDDITSASFILKPYMDDDKDNPVPGVLSFSLSWDGLSRMPYRAELLIEHYADVNGDLFKPPIPIDHTLIPPEFRSGSVSGSIRLLDRDSALVNLSGSLPLPPGEYRLTMSVMMDQDTAPASRLDFAHVYSNLTTPAPFYYGGGDLYISNTSPDSGASFITGFTFEETPNATTVIGSEPGVDGTRLIMIMVPESAILTALTPVVTTADGSVITSPVPAATFVTKNPNEPYGKGEIDFTGPTIWTAQAKNGAVQKYTVVVSMVPSSEDLDKRITYFFLKDYADYPGVIDQDDLTIKVTLPYYKPGTENPTVVTTLIPVISIIGQKVQYSSDGLSAVDIDAAIDFSSSLSEFWVYATSISSETPKKYTATVTRAENDEAEITRFAIDGYPDRPGDISGDKITVTLPYGVSLKNLTPFIQYKGKTLNPASGTVQNFNGPVQYTVTPESGLPKPYTVTITNEGPDKNTGIFDFRVTNVPTAKVVIGQKPRQDGKIPIVIQVPYGTDEKNMLAAITLSSTTSSINPDSGKINFGSPNYQEAIYTVTSQGDTASQDYVVVVSEGPQYYYVDGTNGDDNWPDYYNGGSESHPFKTLAYAVEQAATDGSGIEKIFIKGDLAPLTGGDDIDLNSAFTLDLSSATNKKLTIASTTGATLQGASGKRVLKITGDDVDLTFENINITGGSTSGNGGGVYITGDHNKVKFSGGSITGNTAGSGGGVFIEDTNSGDKTGSEFDFMGNGTISGNTATGAAAGYPVVADMGGGGGVYVKGDALFWLAGGTISGNTTKGAGGGVLVNGDIDTGLFMSGGKIVNNKTTSTTYPHGGGGVYVAHGAFEMLGGEITGNTATRQGGGVFVHWGDARFTASGNSTITGNEGVGSSKAICNRGTTELMGNARADKVYVWNYDDDPPPPYNPNNNQSFSLAENAQVTGIVLAYSAENANVIEIDNSFKGTGVICTIDLEGHLSSDNSLVGELEPDWLHKKIVIGASETLKTVLGIPAGINRLPLNSFTSKQSVYNLGTKYKIEVDDGFGKFEKK